MVEVDLLPEVGVVSEEEEVGVALEEPEEEVC